MFLPLYQLCFSSSLPRMGEKVPSLGVSGPFGQVAMGASINLYIKEKKHGGREPDLLHLVLQAHSGLTCLVPPVLTG